MPRFYSDNETKKSGDVFNLPSSISGSIIFSFCVVKFLLLVLQSANFPCEFVHFTN